MSRAGRVYVRLPDGTLAITKTAADRAKELATGEKFDAKSAVAAAHSKAAKP